jgi:hypothetical protein
MTPPKVVTIRWRQVSKEAHADDEHFVNSEAVHEVLVICLESR